MLPSKMWTKASLKLNLKFSKISIINSRNAQSRDQNCMLGCLKNLVGSNEESLFRYTESYPLTISVRYINLKSFVNFLIKNKRLHENLRKRQKMSEKI